MKLLLYCTKAKPYLYGMYSGFESKYGYHTTNDKNVSKEHTVLNGKIVAECDFEVEEIKPCISPIDKKPYAYMTKTLERWDILEASCLTFDKLDNYLKPKFSGYAIHIKNLNIFDKPRELSDYKGNSKGNFFKIIEKAPQNMQMVLNEKLEDCILISIRSQWLCKILNGEKTIECRKKVLKEMK